MSETVRSADGTAIAFDRVGGGPSLLVVNGALSTRMSSASLAGLLSADFTVYAYDRRGRGDSGEGGPYAVEREIEDLGAVIDAAGGEASVFGHSSGAVLALEAAARGLPIARLAAYEPPYILGEDRPRPLDLGKRVRELVEAGDRGAAVRLFLTEGPMVAEAVVAKMAAGPMWPVMTAMAHTLPYELAVCGDQRIPVARMAGITAPTLVLSGGDSPGWARASARALAAAVPGARHVSLAGQAHSAAADVLAPVLTGFFPA